MLAVTGVYELPVGKGKTFLSAAPRALDYALGGWTLGWTFAAQSGTPVGINGDYNYICNICAAPRNFGQSNGSILRMQHRPVSAACRTSAAAGYTYNTTAAFITRCATPRFQILIFRCRRTSRSPKESASRCGEKRSTRSIPFCWVDRTTLRYGWPANLFTNTTTRHSLLAGLRNGRVRTSTISPRNLRVSGKIIF